MPPGGAPTKAVHSRAGRRGPEFSLCPDRWFVLPCKPLPRPSLSRWGKARVTADLDPETPGPFFARRLGSGEVWGIRGVRGCYFARGA